MEFKRVHYLFAGLSFFAALFTYMYTMQPSIPFWDCGEFASAAFALQVPHPPGSPLWTIIGRFAMMLPTYTDLVARYNFFSVLSSAVTIMILYLTVARLIKLWRGAPTTMADALTTYGGALIAALCYTYTDSFWFNALESEVYAFGSLFMALIPWIMLVWYDHAEEEHSEKYLLLTAYVIGLSMGVHQLALLTIFPCFMLIYYRRRNTVTITSWLGMVVASVLAFFLSYKLVLSYIVEWLGKGGGVAGATVLLFLAAFYAIYWSHKNKKATLNLSLWASVLIFLGYSTYYMIIVRAAQEPPMNQHHADNFKTLTEFINRDQYGYRPPFPRQVGDESGQEGPTFKNYTGNWDFFWRYQTDHMYNRYLAWNFIGRASQDQDAGTDWSKTWGLPFILGLFGLFWHFRRDPKRALTILAAFIFFGWLTAWYQNQQDPQPRERDYFYVGAFYFYAMWVGIGATGIMEWLRARKLKDPNADPEKNEPLPVPIGDGNIAMLGGVLVALVVLVPLNQLAGLAGMVSGKSFAETSKWHEYSRSHNNIPLEYAYNSLQSCEPNAILFTAGDNDTFPLWCAQDVYGIRRDVRIVNLSLANMSWYIQQLKKDVWEGAGKKVDLPGFSDQLLKGEDESENGVRGYVDQPKNVTVAVTAETMKKFSDDPNAGGGSMVWKYRGEFQRQDGFVYTVADQIVRSIVEGNINVRPIYFASAVPGNYQIGLNPYLVWEGMSQRVTPIARASRSIPPVNEKAFYESCFNLVKTPYKEYHRGFLINTFKDPEARWSNADRTNDAPFYSYQHAYELLAAYYLSTGKPDQAIKALNILDENVPPERVAYVGNTAAEISQLYRKAGDTKKAEKFAHFALGKLEKEYQSTLTGTLSQREIMTQLTYAETLIGVGEMDKALQVITKMRETVTDQSFRGNIELRYMQISAMAAEKKGDKKKAIELYDKLFATFGQSLTGSEYEEEFNRLRGHVDSLHQQMGDGTVVAPTKDTAKK